MRLTCTTRYDGGTLTLVGQRDHKGERGIVMDVRRVSFQGPIDHIQFGWSCPVFIEGGPLHEDIQDYVPVDSDDENGQYEEILEYLGTEYGLQFVAEGRWANEFYVRGGEQKW